MTDMADNDNDPFAWPSNSEIVSFIMLFDLDAPEINTLLDIADGKIWDEEPVHNTLLMHGLIDGEYRLTETGRAMVAILKDAMGRAK